MRTDSIIGTFHFERTTSTTQHRVEGVVRLSGSQALNVAVLIGWLGVGTVYRALQSRFSVSVWP